MEAAIRCGVRPEVFRWFRFRVQVAADFPGRLEVLTDPKAVTLVRLGLTAGGYPSWVQTGKPTCVCCASRRFAGGDVAVRCKGCAHFFEVHEIERELRALPPLGTSPASIVVSPKHDLVEHRGGRRCDRCGIIDRGAGLMRACS